MDLSSSKLNKFNFNYRDAFSMSTQKIFVKHTKLERVTKFGTPILVHKKNCEKAPGNAERKEKMKERGHASREGQQERAPSSDFIGTPMKTKKLK